MIDEPLALLAEAFGHEPDPEGPPIESVEAAGFVLDPVPAAVATAWVGSGAGNAAVSQAARA